MPESKKFSLYLRIGIFAACFIAIVVFIILKAGAFINVLLVMLGFGAVVLVHEFGHFIVAKMSNIKVEAFSIFMPPVLFGIQRTEKGYKFRILPEIFPKEGDETGEGALSFIIPKKCKPGETEYRIGLIPFGGFVKMLGQDDVGPVKNNSDPRSFANKSVLTRGAVIAAGVCFNVISAIIIFMIVFLNGIKLPPAKVGGVLPGSPAAIAGIRPGDEIIEIAGKSRDLDFSDILTAAALSGKDEIVSVKVRHTDDSVDEYELKAEALPDQDLRLFGISAPDSLTIAKLSDTDANNLYKETGLRPGDNIKSINGSKLQGQWELADIMENSSAQEVALSAERKQKNGQLQTIDSKIKMEWDPLLGNNLSTTEDLSNICSLVPRLKIAGISEELKSYFSSAAASADQNNVSVLKEGDIILAIDDINLPNRKDMNDVTYKYEDRELAIRVLRTESDGTEKSLNVTVIPKRAKTGKNVIIGLALMLDAAHPVVADTINTPNIKKLEIPKGAVITAVNGTKVSSFFDITREIKKYPGGKITLLWRLDNNTAGAADFTFDTKESKCISIHAIPQLNIPFMALKELYKANGPIQAISMGYDRTINFIVQAYVTLKSLFTGMVSPKNLMGPVGIMRISYRIVSEEPLSTYLYFLGLISATIAVFNFLPVPPLDGGLVVLLIIEKIRGAAISEKTQTLIAYATWAMILALILYVTYNDLTRQM